MSKDVAPNRIKWIDQYRAILFLFVIMVHTDRSPFCLRACYDFFYLPGFFFLSGYLFKAKSYKESMIGVINGLLIPLMIYYAILSLLTLLVEADFRLVFESFTRKVLSGDAWFIPCLISLEIMFITFYYLIRPFSNYFTLLLLIVSVISYFYFTSQPFRHYPWNIDTASWCLIYFIIGTLFKTKSVFFGKRFSIFIFGGYSALAILFSYIGIAGGGMIDIHNNYVYNPITYIFLSIFGVFAFFWLARNLPISEILCKFGQYTLFAFPFQTLIYQKILKILHKIGVVDILHNDLVFVTVMTFLVFLTLYVVGSVLMRYAPALMGKYKYIN